MRDNPLRIETAEVFAPLLAGARHLGAYGGRGSGKSHFFGEMLTEDAVSWPGENGNEGLRAICLREVQKDLAQSSKALLESKLRKFRLTEAHGFKVFRDVISTPGDGIITFRGMNDFTADSIKSLEGYARAWWDEAQTATSTSIEMLIPTIRAKGSRLYWSWNPRLKTDAVDVMFRGEQVPSSAISVMANWRDNPWISQELLDERIDFLRMNPDRYHHVWEGGYVSAIKGAYYAKQLADARMEGRVGFFGPDPLLTRRLFVDIGGTGARADNFVILVAQFVGREVRVLDHYEAQGQPLEAHLTWLRKKKLLPEVAKIWLPHDGATKDRVLDVSYESLLEQAGYDVEVITNQGPGAATARIEAGRRIFPSTRFNEATTGGCLDALGWYHEKIDKARGIGLGPDHDWSSHVGDAFGLMAIVAEDEFRSAPAGSTMRRRKVSGMAA